MQMQNTPTPKFHPHMPPQMQAKMGVAPPPPAAPEAQPQADAATPVKPASSASSSDIVAHLEEHLNQIPDAQKQYLAQALSKAPQLTISVLGIVCGPEVYDYFTELYNKYFKDSAQGQQPQGQPQAAPQASAPQPSAGPQMAPMSQPSQQSVMNPQPQAKATPPQPAMGV